MDIELDPRLDFTSDYISYNQKRKESNIIDNVNNLDKPKLNRNNRLFAEDIDKITYNDVNIFLDNINGRKDSDNAELENSYQLLKLNDDGLYVHSTTDRAEEKA